MTLQIAPINEIKVPSSSPSFQQKTGVQLKGKSLVKCYIWGMALCGAKTLTLLKVDQKHLESSETWCWRRIEFSWSYRVRNEEVRVLYRVKEERKFLQSKSNPITGLDRP
jgi:hypothetical protein